MQSIKALARYVPPAFLITSLMIIYISTLAPGLTWANGGSDGGDLISAAVTGGVAHPTGYPLYLLLARVFQFLPFGSLAFCTNLMSALATALGAALVYRLVTRSLVSFGVTSAWLGGLAAGYAFGLAPLVWSQAVITEVYALQALLILLILSLYVENVPTDMAAMKRLDCWRGLLLGLAMGNHITTIFLVPIALFLGSAHRKTNDSGSSRLWYRRILFHRASLRRQLIWFGVGLLVYSILPLRAFTHPPINWGNPVTLERFWWLVSGQLYRSYYLQVSLDGLWEGLRAWATLLLGQFGLPGLTLGLLGLVVFGRATRLYILTTWIALVFSLFDLFYRSADSYLYLIPVFISFAIWIGLGVSGLTEGISKRNSTLGFVFGLLMVSYFLGGAAINFNRVDASHDTRAEDFAHEVLATAPENALVFAKGDRAIFTLWYFHFAIKERPDLVVIAADLLHFEWYQETLQSTYPSLSLLESYPWPATIEAANPARPVCSVEYTDVAEVECAE